jgi:hypothetical protein
MAFVTPEVVLLYKAGSRETLEATADFDAALPRLESRQRRWLAEALDLAHPGHRWRDRL